MAQSDKREREKVKQYNWVVRQRVCIQDMYIHVYKLSRDAKVRARGILPSIPSRYLKWSARPVPSVSLASTSDRLATPSPPPIALFLSLSLCLQLCCCCCSRSCRAPTRAPTRFFRLLLLLVSTNYNRDLANLAFSTNTRPSPTCRRADRVSARCRFFFGSSLLYYIIPRCSGGARVQANIGAQ